MKDSQVCLQKWFFPNKEAKDKDRDAKATHALVLWIYKQPNLHRLINNTAA